MDFLSHILRWLQSTFRTGGFWFNTFFILLVVVVMTVGVWLSVEHWGWLQGTTESNSTTVRNVGLLSGGAIALVFALWRGIVAGHQADAARRQAEVAQQGLLNERYQKGAEMLDSEVLAVRIGGIYALQRLVVDNPKQYHVQTMSLLCAFVRHPTKDGTTDSQAVKLREDVQAIMDIIRIRSEECVELEKRNNFTLNLRDADLKFVSFPMGNLSSANLQNADLSYAKLRCANLSHANLYKVKLCEALLSEVCLCGAELSEANLSLAQLDDAKLCNARLPRAILCSASLKRTDLSGAFIRDAKLANADLTSAKLPNAYIAGTQFYNLDSETSSDKWPVLGLTQAQLDEVEFDASDSPPRLDGFVTDSDTGKPLVLKS